MRKWGLILSFTGLAVTLALLGRAYVARPSQTVAIIWLTVAVWLAVIGVSLMAVHVHRELNRQHRLIEPAA